MSRRHGHNTSWPLRMCDVSSRVQMDLPDEDRILIVMRTPQGRDPNPGSNLWWTSMPRSDARLLARRLNQCLDGTKVK